MESLKNEGPIYAKLMADFEHTSKALYEYSRISFYI